MGTLRSLVAKIGLDVDGLQKGVQKAQGLVKGFAANFASVGKTIGIGLAAGVTAASVAAVGAATVGFVALGGAALSASQQVQAGQGLIQASLGVTEERAQQLGQVALNVWKNNFGESITDVNGVLIQTRQQLGEMSDSDLQKATENTIALRDAFDFGEDESLNAVKTLMDEMGLSAQQAFDFIVKGQQEGLNASGDFLDSISEYGNQFAGLGFRADQMFSLYQTGIAGGVLGTDKINDAVKEWGIIMSEGGEGARQALSSIGLDYGQLAGQVSRGESTWADSFDQIINGINAIQDPIERSRVQAALFGEVGRDLGPNFTMGLSTSKTSMEDMAGATESLNAQYNTLGSVATGIWRRMVVAVMPVTDELLRLANEAMPYVEDLFTRAEPIIANFGTTMGNLVAPAALIISTALSRIGASLGLVSDDTTAADILMTALWGTLNGISLAVQWGVIAFDQLSLGIEYVANSVRDFLGRAQPSIDEFTTKLQGTLGPAAESIQESFSRISAVITPILETLAGKLGLVGGGVSGTDIALQVLKNSFDSVAGAVQQVTGLLQEGADNVATFFERAQPIIDQFSIKLKGTLGPAVESINQSFSRISAVVGPILIGLDNSLSDVGGNVSWMDLSLKALEHTLNAIVIAVQLAAATMYFLAEAVETVSRFVSEGLAGLSKFNGALSVAGAYIFGSGDSGERSFGGDSGPTPPPSPAVNTSASSEQQAEMLQALQALNASIQEQPIQVQATLDGAPVVDFVTKRIGSGLANRQASRVGS